MVSQLRDFSKNIKKHWTSLIDFSWRRVGCLFFNITLRYLIKKFTRLFDFKNVDTLPAVFHVINWNCFTLPHCFSCKKRKNQPNHPFIWYLEWSPHMISPSKLDAPISRKQFSGLKLCFLLSKSGIFA